MKRLALPLVILLVCAVSMWLACTVVWFHLEVGDDLEVFPTRKVYATAAGLVVLSVAALVGFGLVLRRLSEEGERPRAVSLAVMLGLALALAGALTLVVPHAVVRWLVWKGDVASETQEALEWYGRALEHRGELAIPMLMARLRDTRRRLPAFVVLANWKGMMEVAEPGQIVGATLRPVVSYPGPVREVRVTTTVYRRLRLLPPDFTRACPEQVVPRQVPELAREVEEWFRARGFEAQ